MRIFIFLLLALLSSISYGQGSTVYLRGDTISVEKTGGNAELRIKNATRARTGAFLSNVGGGVTGFKYAIDSAWKSGDSLYLRRGDGTIAVLAGGTMVNIYNSDGTITGTRTIGLNGNALIISDLLTQYGFARTGFNFHISDATGDNYTDVQEFATGFNVLINSPTSNSSLTSSADEWGINVNGNGVAFKPDSVWSSLVMIAPNFRTWNGWAELVEAGTSGGLIIKNSAGAIVGYHAGNAVMSTTHEYQEVNQATISTVANAGVMVANSSDSARPYWIDKYGGRRKFLLFGDAAGGGGSSTDSSIYATRYWVQQNYQLACNEITLTDGATVSWNYSTSCAAAVTVAGNRTLSISNLPTSRVSVGTLVAIQDATGGRTLAPPAGVTNRGIKGLNLTSSGLLPTTAAGGSHDIFSFYYVPARNTMYWTYGPNFN